MLLRNLFEAADNEVAIIFGRFNPPHKGHRAAWELASQSPAWFVGTNESTVGPKDPLPYNVKVEAMKTVWPEVAGHIVAETSWLTMASKVYEKYPNSTLLCLTDEDWVTKTIIQYNGKEGAHGFYNFKNITQKPTPRLSSATALRDAVAKGDRSAFSQAAGVSADIKVAGKPFFDLVAEYLLPYSDAPKKVAKKKKEPAVAELFDPGKDWKWSFKGSEEAVAVFHVGEIPYQFYAYRPSENHSAWDVEFKNAERGKDRSTKFGLTGTGNSAEVMSTVTDIMRAFLQEYKGKISELTFTANEASRQALYARMAKRLLPTWELQQDGKEFKLSAPGNDQQGVAEDMGQDYQVGEKVLTQVGSRWIPAVITKPINAAGNYGVKFKVGAKVMNYVSSPDQLKKQGVAEGSGKNVVKSIKVGNFRHDLVDTGFGWQVRIYNGDELYYTDMSKNTEQKGLAALEDAVAYTEKQTRTKRQGVVEGSSKAMAQAASRLTDPKDGATAKLRAAGDKRREDQLKSRNIAKKNEAVDLKTSLQELSNDMLGKYKKAAGADAGRADAAGDFKRGDKRFKGINRATVKQFDNDAKKTK